MHLFLSLLLELLTTSMLCDDVDSLHQAIQALRALDSKVSSSDNVDVDRLYNSSPPLMDQVATYELDSLFQNELEPEREEDGEETSGKKDGESEKGGKEGDDGEEKKEGEGDKEENGIGSPSAPTSSWGKILCQPREDVFRALPLQPLQGPASSLLTKQLLSPQFSSQFGGGLKLTIFLPDTSPLVLHVDETNTYEQVVAKVLAVHRDKGIKPPLRYDSPGEYELYLNEGDGVPDRDFVFRKTQKISENKVDEYCLCEADEDAAPSPATMSFSAMSSSRGSTMRYDSRGGGTSPLQGLDALVVTVSIPTSNRGESVTVKLPYDEGTTMRHLLLDIADKKKVSIRLYTDEFSFVVSAEDQARLKLISPIVDLSTLVSSVCECKFELQKRAFEDSARVHSRTFLSKSASSVVENNLGETNAVLYNETTAVMLQQWNVVKKNKLGSRQERIIGIDGKCIYNSKRDQRPGMGVKVPSRDISLVQSIEVLDDNLTFKINWKEDKNPVYSIEYCCQNERDCAEIQGKINYILSKRARLR